jgi:alkylation response protein AidB-like acyl-CoA dehydrogenase
MSTLEKITSASKVRVLLKLEPIGKLKNTSLALKQMQMPRFLALDTLVGYLTTRKQFGRLIGSYQALKHPTVDILLQMDSARTLIYHAATLINDASLNKDTEIACRMAKAQATDALLFAGDRSVQFHGGMGFTYDCDAMLYIRRAQWAQHQYGDAQHHRKLLAPLLLD